MYSVATKANQLAALTYYYFASIFLLLLAKTFQEMGHMAIMHTTTSCFLYTAIYIIYIYYLLSMLFFGYDDVAKC